MIDLYFDNNGFLTPYEIIEIDLKSFEYNFVNHRENYRRKELFNNYKNYTSDFCNKITKNYIQWIDGSFVTKGKSKRY